MSASSAGPLGLVHLRAIRLCFVWEKRLSCAGGGVRGRLRQRYLVLAGLAGGDSWDVCRFCGSACGWGVL